ncbi:DNA gyrase, B subunit [mine drainage metagenome]|uniref:DNA topoisomerase (ATP-hydrolyzing) n=1 Tax=mine drainage metagenome TaxID=410659 RepID=T0ZHP6_9ZZZZ
MSEEYSGKDIMVLSGPQGVRKRPAMYVGSTGIAGFTHLLYEVVDNAIDEATAGYCTNIAITLSEEDGVDVAEVSDNGRGIPVDIVPKVNKPALEVIMTSLHSGAKFDNKIYKVSGGLHGVGMTVVNSLSEYTVVTVKRNGKIYRESFSRGTPTSQLEEIGETDEKDTGTTVRFKPDSEIFSVKKFDTTELQERLRDISFLSPGLKITLVDNRQSPESKIEYFSDKGLYDFLNYIRKGKEPISKPIFIEKEVDGVKVNVIFQYVPDYSEELISFVNRIKTNEGGMHVTGFRAALTRTISNYMGKNSKKGKQIEIQGDDTREGLICVISILMPNPEFEGQTKEKLGNTTIKSIVDSIVYSEFSTYLEENPAEAAKIIGKVQNAAEARESAKKARELVRKKSIFDGPILSGKLADCTETNPEKSEIFIVEGDSAAGSSKQGRDRFFQAILPLRGKVLNVEKATDEKIFNNKELHTMVIAFGTGIKESFDVSKVRYKKIILLTDADVDGSHIRTLLLTFFYRYLKPVIEHGYVYIAQPPLYKLSKGREVTYLYNDSELDGAMKKYGGNPNVQRYKGLGEMNPEQLWETTMDPKTRVMKKVMIKDAELADSMFTILMGMDVEKRRKFLEEHSKEVKFLDI